MPRRRLSGRVVSDKMEKTVIVQVERTSRHPVYSKILRTVKKYVAHDEEGAAREGDWVTIEESRPLSRTKRWRVVEVAED
ncbi:MAG: 30S ribosomal protein S17 [Anaerolineae bacterium]|jgi:small subunit ribosomal protein S17|nr:30S ribosomal protein S17 [Chloroflexota bacterium]